MIRKYLRSAWEAWDRFWFESEEPRSQRLFQRCLGGLLLSLYGIRLFDLEEFYSPISGMMPQGLVLESMPMAGRLSLFDLYTGASAWTWILWGAAGLQMLAFLGLIFQVLPRISATVAFLLHVSFVHRNMGVIFGVDMVATFYLMYAILGVNGVGGSIGRRLGQVQLCVIYGYSGLEKLKGATWWSGEALWYVLANSQLARFDMTWMASFPIVIVLATYATLLWEIYFPVLVWVKPLRKPLLAFGVLLHFQIGLLMSIPHFGAIMALSYLNFFQGRPDRRD